MGKTFKRNSDDYDEYQVRESKKEAKIRKRKGYEESEVATYSERHK